MSAALAIEWTRPLALWSLSLAPLLWLLSRRLQRPRLRATGTLALWERLERAPRSGAGGARGTPPAVRFAIAALALAGLALAGPRWAEPPRRALWTVVVDGSPSMGLPRDGPRGPGEAATSRLEVAVARAVELLAEVAAAEDLVRWTRRGHEDVELAIGARPSQAWCAIGPWFDPEPRWELHDEPGVLWVTDRAPVEGARAAGWVASGGVAVGGTIAVDGTSSLIAWAVDGSTRVAGSAPRRDVAVLSHPGVEASSLVELFELWRRERGHARASGPGVAGAALVLEFGESAGPATPVVAGRERWSLRGEVATAAPSLVEDAPAEAELWLTGRDEDGVDRPVVVASPGRIRTAWRRVDEPAGDPAAFALSWSRLFDAWIHPVPGVVPLAEREDAGALDVRAPSAPEARDGDPGPAAPRRPHDAPAAWLAVAAAVLGLVAAALGVRSS